MGISWQPVSPVGISIENAVTGIVGQQAIPPGQGPAKTKQRIEDVPPCGICQQSGPEAVSAFQYIRNDPGIPCCGTQAGKVPVVVNADYQCVIVAEVDVGSDRLLGWFPVLPYSKLVCGFFELGTC